METTTKLGLAAIAVLLLLLCGAWALILSGNFPALISLAPTAKATPAPTNTPVSTPTSTGTPTNTSTPENTPTLIPTPFDTPTPMPPFPTPQAAAELPDRPLRIAYMSGGDGDWEIIVAGADGSNPQNISNDPGLDAFPVWSAQNELIAWGSDRFGPGLELMLANVDGSPATNLSQAPNTDDFDAIWSPNGQILAFNSNRLGDAEVFVATIDGNLYNLSSHEADDVLFDWTPACANLSEGDDWSDCRVLIGSNRGSDSADAFTLYTVSADGQQFSFATNPDLRVLDAAYSPDGSQIAYIKADPATDQLDLYVIDLKSEEETQLTDDENIEAALAWSPQGDAIAYLVALDEVNDLFLVSVLNGEISNLTNTPTSDEGLNNDFAWSPDGTKILFSANRDGNVEIYVINADGSNPINLTNTPGPEIEPIWLP